MPLTSQALAWQPTEQIIREVPCTCVDGRTTGHRFSAAGGSLGIILAVLNEYEGQSGRALSEMQVAEALALFADRVGPVYLHSDTTAVAAMLARMGLAPDTSLASLNQSQQRSFIELASQADYQGCGHVHLLLTRPAEYGLNISLVEKSLRATLKLWFAGHADVIFDLLPGAHAESAVVLIDGQRSRPMGESTALANTPDRFYCHRPLKYELIRRFVAVLQAAGWTAFTPEAASRIARHHDAAAERTLSALASRLPVEHLTL